jgi:hypothetical protein
VLGAARLIPHLPVPLPVCGLRALTGMPCPLCGSTRSLMAWSHLQVAEAFRFNPLAAMAVVATVGWLLLSAFERCSGHRWTTNIAMHFQKRPWLALLLAAIGANWLYLVLCLPK